MSGYGIAAGLMSLAASSFVDRFDRKYVLLTGYAGFTVSTLCCARPRLRVADGRANLGGRFGGMTAGAITAVIGDVFPPACGTAMGAVMSAFAVASITGLPAGLTLANFYGYKPLLSCWLCSAPQSGHGRDAAAERSPSS